MLCFAISYWNSSHISSWNFRVSGAVLGGGFFLVEPIEEVVIAVCQNWSAAPRSVLVRKKGPWSCAGAVLGL